MPNRRHPPPLQQIHQQHQTGVSTSSSTSSHTHNARLQQLNRDPGILAFTSSQFSSSSTLVDNNNVPLSNNPTSPINIPAGARRLHNSRNQSLGSASEFQSSPRSLGPDISISSSTGSPTNPFEGSPVAESPVRPPTRRTTTTPNNIPTTMTPPPIRKAAKSSDYALSVVFSQFEASADKKMELILNMGVDAEVDFRKILAAGADQPFDKLIKSLSSLATSQQKQVIDAVMRWRRAKIEPLDQDLVRRVSESAPLSRTKDVTSILKERQSLASVYILCRALIEIVKSFTPETLPEDLGENLEEIVFNQLKKADPEAIRRSKNRTASMDLFAELIGELSNVRFASVSDRFIAELEKYNSQTIMKERQSHMEMLIRGMRFLKIKIYPLDALEETADFLSSCASFFRNAHGAKVKHSYAKLFVQLLLPIAGVAVAEVNFPAWAKAVDIVYPRAWKMTLKPRHVLAGYPLVTTLLCVSRKEFFAANWMGVVESCYQKFSKDKYTRQLTLGCVSRLVWSYLFRCTESTAIAFKKLDGIIKTLFPPFRRAIYPSETPLDHFILITYFMLMRDIDTAMKSVVYYLLNADNVATTLHWEYINPERMIIALRAFRLMLCDLERGNTRPPFPVDPDMHGTGISMNCSANMFTSPIRAIKPDVIDRIEEITHKSLLSLDQAFGRLIVLDDKTVVQKPPGSMSSNTSSGGLGGGNYSVPMFVNSVGISGTSESGPQVQHQYPSFAISYSKEKQAYLDVLRAIFDSMPRLMPAGIPLPKLVEMLSRYTVHADPELIQSASQALLRIAEQIDSQTVVTGYARFVYRIEDKYWDMIISLASGPLTGGSHNGNGGVMKLYVDLLATWVDHIDLTPLKELDIGSSNETPTAMQDGDSGGKGGKNGSSTSVGDLAADVHSDVSRLFNMVEETEANGLLFLCNQSSAIRRSAIQIIKLAGDLEQRLRGLISDNETELARRLMKHFSIDRKYIRLYNFLESAGQEMLKFDKETSTLLGSKISIETRIRIQQHQRRGSQNVLIQIIESDHPYDMAIWNACYPEICKRCFEYFPGTVALCRQNICTRLLQIQPFIQGSFETAKAGTAGTLSMSKSSTSQKVASGETIEQWKMYIIFACATATLSEDRSPVATWASSGRKGSAVVHKIASAHDLFRMTLQYLTCEHRAIREAAIQGLGNVNKDAYKILINGLQNHVRIILDDGKQRNNQKPYQNKRSKKHDRLRISLMHVFELTANCLQHRKFLEDKDVMNVIMSYIKETKSFLQDSEIQLEWEYHKLRVYLCGLVERLYEKLMQLDDPTSVMSFETRLSLYKMFEEWCGYGICANATRSREAAMIQDVLEQCKDSQERASATQLMEEERKALETASLSAMAMLCRGPLYAFLGQKKARQAVIQFDMLNVLKWIDAVFESPDPKYHPIARRALEAVLIYNQDQPLLLDDVIEQCYAGNPKLEFTQGYFLALADIVTKVEDYPCHIHQIMSLALFKSGDAKKTIRKSAINLLRVIEDRVFADSCAKEYEIGITSNLPTIYKHTQTLLSARLAVDHPEQTFSMLSEITQRFDNISSNSQREVLVYLLPWLRKIDLSVGPQDTELSASAYMVLSNIYYLTIKFGDTYVKEIGALWSQVVDHGRNIRAIIMYLLDMGLEMRNPWFLLHAKRVFVCLGRTPAFTRIVEDTIAEITPRSMVPQLKEISSKYAQAFPLLYVADTAKALNTYSKRPVFSRGQMAMVFLVDLAIEAGADLAPHLPLLLHTIFVQLDHLTSIICDQSRCFLINLIHSIVIRQSIDSEASNKAAELIQWLTAKEGKRLWAYENITPKNRHLQSAEELGDLLHKVVEVFSHEDPDLRQKWGETALKWATCCSVRHIACRSFECFRTLMPAFNQHMLADMLARLSNTIADKSDEIRGFALEIILTLTKVTKNMDQQQIEQFPQIFWAAVGCLYSPYEAEHTEALVLLEVVLEKYGFSNDLASCFPKNWASEFEGLQPLLLKGLQFESAEEKTFSILSSIMLIENPPLIDPSETRLLFLLLGSLCRLLHGLDVSESSDEPDAFAIKLADELARLFEWYSLPDVHRILATYPKQKSKFQEDYLKQLLGSIREVFLNKYANQAMMFALLLVKNKKSYYREKGLMIVENLIPYVKKNDPRSTGTSIPIDITTFSSLLNLVQTEYADKALSILNAGIPVANISQPPSIIKDHPSSIPPPTPTSTAPGVPQSPRISNGERASNTDTTNAANALWGFGPAAVSLASQITRHNVHAVVFECSSATNQEPVEHNIQFSIEDFSLLTGEPPRQDPNDSVSDEVEVPTSTVSAAAVTTGVARPAAYGEELINALKDLDDFFNEDVETSLTPSSSSSRNNVLGPESRNSGIGFDSDNEEDY
ncbi:cell morphogenesis N-terminal-domain-containing protein [Phascolomyces articulosus]|uniref:Cell morphogenesis N-terminal-domain-containing protein n=1 Tax=Phascolomyces articulosus TaxID=60185 RepID=A0AAD5K8C2_9FUNG|nr:cell morphogenesis N-terminal-domain-containing protein [Phascolomyces articulosus]